MDGGGHPCRESRIGGTEKMIEGEQCRRITTMLRGADPVWVER
jgi:hypothetical protein